MAIVMTGDTVGLKDHQQQNIFTQQIMTSWVMPLSAALNTTRSGQILPGNSLRATGFSVWTLCVHLASTRVTDSIWSYGKTPGKLCCCGQSFRSLDMFKTSVLHKFSYNIFLARMQILHTVLPEWTFCTLCLIQKYCAVIFVKIHA